MLESAGARRRRLDGKRQLAAKNDGESYSDLTNGCQRLAYCESAHLAEAPSAFDIRSIKLREDLVTSRLDDRRVRHSFAQLLEPHPMQERPVIMDFMTTGANARNAKGGYLFRALN